jgi:hypothetical protein
VLKWLKTGAIAATLMLAACNQHDTTATGAAPAHEPAATSAAPAEAPHGTAATGTPVAAGRATAEHAPAWHEVTVPAGTELPIVLDTAVASDTSRAEQPVRAHLSRAVVVHGETALPEGSRLSGVVSEVERSGRVKGRAHIAVRFSAIVPRGEDEQYPISAPAIARTAAATKKKDAVKIGAPAAGGALIGGLIGGKKGALVGAGVGGGAGTAYVLSTRGDEVRLARGTALTLRITEPIKVKVREGSR